MSDSPEKLHRELEAARRAVAELQARLERREAEHRTSAKELEDNRSALLFMLEDLEAGRKKIERAYQEWIAALDAVDDAIFLHDAQFRILRCNQAYRKCAGIPFKEIIGRPYWEVFPKGAGPTNACATLHHHPPQGGKEKVVAEEELTLPGGGIFFCRNFEAHNTEGGYLFSVHVMENVTERKRIEAALRDSEEKFRRISESAQDAIIMMGADQRISFWNAAAERIFGYTAEEALGQELHSLIVPPLARVAFAQSFPHFQQSGEGPLIGKLIEVSALRKGGKEFPVELSISATQLGGQWHAISIVRDISERKRTENALHHLNRALKTLGTVNHALVYATDENVLLHTVCHAIAEDGYQLAWVGYVQHDVNKTIKVMTHAGHEAGYLETLGMTWADNERGQGLCGQAIRSSTTQVCQNILSDPDFCVTWRNEALKRGYASIISLPLASEEGVFGVLCVHAAEADAFTVGEISLLDEMAADLAFGVSMLRLRLERDWAMKQSQNYLGGLRDSLEETVRAIALTVEMRDPYTAGHQRRVADLATAIATQLGLPAEQVHGIHLAGVVHDLGKINIPAEILSKPGKITDLEFSLIKIHPQAGYDILKDINFPWPIAQMVLQHHERLDGSGYPQGLKGDAILLEARILSVADVVEAMSSHRPYRPGLGIEVALTEITKQRGSHFDPVVVDACLVLFREQHYSFNI